MRRVLVVAAYSQLPGEVGFSRYYYIAEQLAQRGCDVTFVTSKFRHYDKTHRTTFLPRVSDTLKVVLLDELGYKKNIGLKRIISHKHLAFNLKQFLNKNKKAFDVVYVGIPVPELGIVAAKYAKNACVPFVIDVMDIWPEAMKMVFNYPILSDILFYSLKQRINKVYSAADIVFGVSQTYVDRAMSVNKKATHAEAVFIGTDLFYFDQLASQNIDGVEKLEGEFWITYIGTLGHSYDIKTLIYAVDLLRKKYELSDIKLMVLGDGPLRKEFESLANQLQINVEFTGFLDYSTMIRYLKRSDVAVNSIRKNAAQSIVTKVGDYMAAGLPILNGSMNAEFVSMVDTNGIGINYKPEQPESLACAIYELYSNIDLRKQMGLNSRRLAEDKFDRGKSYQAIYKAVLENSPND